MGIGEIRLNLQNLAKYNVKNLINKVNLGTLVADLMLQITSDATGLISGFITIDLVTNTYVDSLTKGTIASLVMNWTPIPKGAKALIIGGNFAETPIADKVACMMEVANSQVGISNQPFPLTALSPTVFHGEVYPLSDNKLLLIFDGNNVAGNPWTLNLAAVSLGWVMA